MTFYYFKASKNGSVPEKKAKTCLVVQLSFQFLFPYMLILIMENSINFICSW